MSRAACCVFSKQSIVGTASFCNFLRIFSDCVISAFTVNAVSSTCIEHNTDYFWGTNFGRCLRTKVVHLLSLSLSFGKRCTDIPSVCWLFVQLFPFGHPTTQYCPPRCLFGLIFEEANVLVLAAILPVCQWSFLWRNRRNFEHSHRKCQKCQLIVQCQTGSRLLNFMCNSLKWSAKHAQTNYSPPLTRTRLTRTPR